MTRMLRTVAEKKASKAAWWVAGSFGILLFGLAQAGIAAYKLQASGGDAGIVIAAVSAVIVNVIVWPLAYWLLVRRQLIRLRVLRDRFPTALVIPAWRVCGLETALKEHGGALPRLLELFALVVDEAGVGLWKGAQTPERFAFVPATEIGAVVRDRGYVGRTSSFVNVVTLSPAEQGLQPIPFSPTYEGWMSALAQTSGARVDAVCDRVQAALGIDAEVAPNGLDAGRLR